MKKKRSVSKCDLCHLSDIHHKGNSTGLIGHLLVKQSAWHQVPSIDCQGLGAPNNTKLS